MAITNSNEDYSQMDKTNITSEAILNLNSVKNNYDSSTQIPMIFIEPLNLILFNGKFYGDNNFWIGTCTTAKGTLNKVATVEGDFKLRKGVSVLIKFSATNSAAANATLNVNNTGDYVIYYNAAPITSKGAAGGVANKYILYVFDGTYWVAHVGDINSNTTYSTITVAEITGATATTGRLISAKLLTDELNKKVDIISGATDGNFAALDANGNLTDSGHKHSDYLTSHQDISGKEDTTVIQTVTSGTTAITTTVNTYYNVEGTVTSLTVTLPVPDDTTKISVIIIHLTTGSTASVIFSSTATVDHINSYNVSANKEYELKCWYNGSKWIVSSSEII